ncbi:hypothetical protein F511_05750 [Dorcoceras hygrometricum]|uniref:Uncharacterized protein n=1 Tax=Dorcoceras hygrometricum TaxID=472368 RepID=A0A2Z7BB47_9LAMI|nr:hypothetical protein F511_05750 [Dorcoceras hygrometricum]
MLPKRDGIHGAGEEADVPAKLPVFPEAECFREDPEKFLPSEEGHLGSDQIDEEVEEDALDEAQKWAAILHGAAEAAVPATE